MTHQHRQCLHLLSVKQNGFPPNTTELSTAGLDRLPGQTTQSSLNNFYSQAYRLFCSELRATEAVSDQPAAA
jgi:hypothetical protein